MKPFPIFCLFLYVDIEFCTRKPDRTSRTLVFDKYTWSAYSTGQALF